MKQIAGVTIFLLLFMVLGIPALVLMNYKRPVQIKNGTVLSVRVLEQNTKKILSIPLEDYIVGVVAAEMPANFEIEALKAQAVAARTYTVKRMFSYGAKPDETHPEAEICTDPTHCQAWLSPEDMKKKWGKFNYYIYIDKIKKAVAATKGEVITYNGILIDPVYHGSCGGSGTENSENVWGNVVPYLRGVDCKNEYEKEKQTFSVAKTKEELITALNNGAAPVIPVSNQADFGLECTKKTVDGRILEAKFMGKKISGIQLRQILGLTSTLIDWKAEGNKIIFTSRGKGHAVGMCQYGANGMALKGSRYKDIISHYYTGVKIVKIR